MIAARLAGIRVFATGGIGGVHRGGAATMDVSADLDELATTPVLVVCAGPKSMLDVDLTLEYLETRGVPVLGWGTTDLAGFYARSSGRTLAGSVADAQSRGASVASDHWALGIDSGLVICAPLPADAALPAEEAESAIAQATADCGGRGHPRSRRHPVRARPRRRADAGPLSRGEPRADREQRVDRRPDRHRPGPGAEPVSPFVSAGRDVSTTSKSEPWSV